MIPVTIPDPDWSTENQFQVQLPFGSMQFYFMCTLSLFVSKISPRGQHEPPCCHCCPSLCHRRCCCRVLGMDAPRTPKHAVSWIAAWLRPCFVILYGDFVHIHGSQLLLVSGGEGPLESLSIPFQAAETVRAINFLLQSFCASTSNDLSEESRDSAGCGAKQNSRLLVRGCGQCRIERFHPKSSSGNFWLFPASELRPVRVTLQFRWSIDSFSTKPI